MTATKYGVMVRTERLDDTGVVDARCNLEDELERELGESLTIQPPGRKLSASTDAMITLGTVLASNPELAKQLLRTVIDHPRFELKDLSADDRALFTVDVDVDVSGFDVDVTVFEQYKGTTIRL